MTGALAAGSGAVLLEKDGAHIVLVDDGLVDIVALRFDAWCRELRLVLKLTTP